MYTYMYMYIHACVIALAILLVPGRMHACNGSNVVYDSVDWVWGQ